MCTYIYTYYKSRAGHRGLVLLDPPGGLGKRKAGIRDVEMLPKIPGRPVTYGGAFEEVDGSFCGVWGSYGIVWYSIVKV